MNFPEFWALGRSGDFLVWRWSYESLREAQALADEAARQLAERFSAGIIPARHGAYYPDRPFREEVLRNIQSGTGETSAVITRNSYGCVVLNTARVMFVDIDFPEPKKAGLFRRLFGKPDLASVANPQSDAMARIERWTRKNPEWGWRIYRTHSGLRLLATQGLLDPASETANQVFAALGADPLYRRLCQAQNCFRARLTPKPWRCGMLAKPARWPWMDAKQEERFRKWEAKYVRCSADRATCEFMRHLGNAAVHPEVQAVIELHDDPTRAASKMRLA